MLGLKRFSAIGAVVGLNTSYFPIAFTLLRMPLKSFCALVPLCRFGYCIFDYCFPTALPHFGF